MQVGVLVRYMRACFAVLVKPQTASYTLLQMTIFSLRPNRQRADIRSRQQLGTER